MRRLLMIVILVPAVMFFASALQNSFAQNTNSSIPFSTSLEKVADHSLVKLIGKKYNNADAVKALAGNGWKKNASSKIYRREGANTDIAIYYYAEFAYVFFEYKLKSGTKLREVITPSESLPLGFKWGTSETELIQFAGLPAYGKNESVFGEIGSTYYYLLPVSGKPDKIMRVGFSFSLYESGDFGRLRRITFSMSDKTDKILDYGDVPGDKFAGHLLKQGPVAPQTMAISMDILNRQIESGKKNGVNISRTLYPFLTSEKVNQTYATELTLYPGTTYYIVILVKDSFATAQNQVHIRSINSSGANDWARTLKFEKLVYEKSLNAYRTSVAFTIPALNTGSRCRGTLTYYDSNLPNRPVYAQVYSRSSAANDIALSAPGGNTTTPPSAESNNKPVTALQFAQQYKDSYTQQQGYYYTQLSPGTTNSTGFRTFAGCERPGYELTVNFFVDQKYNLSIEVSKSCVGQPVRTVNPPNFSLVSVVNGIKIYTDKFGRWSEQGSCSQCNYYFTIKTNSPTMTEVPMVITTTKLQ